jgi:hypothetical protein
MTSVLIRDVPEPDLERIRAEAAREGSSLQSYLARLIEMHVAYLTRREAIAATERRLAGAPALTDEDRAAVRTAMDEALDGLGSRHADRLSE